MAMFSLANRVVAWWVLLLFGQCVWAQSPGGVVTVPPAPGDSIFGSRVVEVGQSIELRTSLSSFDAQSFQWKKDGVTIAAATAHSFSVPAATPADEGTYSVITIYVKSGLEIVSSVYVTVKPPSAPRITSLRHTDPVPYIGQGWIPFEFETAGSFPQNYQWLRNGTPITGATQKQFSLAAVKPADEGDYSVAISNAFGEITSVGEKLTVLPAVLPVLSRASDTFRPYNEGTTLDFTAPQIRFGSAPFRYQWEKDGVPLPGATGERLVIQRAIYADSGDYRVVVSNAAGAVASELYRRPMSGPDSDLAIVTIPTDKTVAAGSTAVFSVTVRGFPLPDYQWRRNGLKLAGATTATLVIKNTTAADTGSYDCIVSNSRNLLTTSPSNLTIRTNIATTADVGRLVNLSVLSTAGAGGNSLTLGAVIGPPEKTGPLSVVARAVGPTLGLAPFGLPGVLPDPLLTVNTAGRSLPLASNDNWGDAPATAAAFAAVGAFALPVSSLDSAYVSPAPGLGAGSYTIQVAGKGGSSGSVLAELYDASGPTRTATTPRLINLSTLSKIDSGATLSVGFVIGGLTARTVLVRAIGPTLGASFGMSSVLPSPTLELFDNNAAVKISDNNDWSGHRESSPVATSVGAFALAGLTTRDAVILATLSPGTYSARVGDANSAAGTVIVEIYEVP